MAVIRLPVLQPDALRWPRTLADCETSPRPCPLVRCKANLLIDLTRDGGLVLNTQKSGRAKDRAIPPRRALEEELTWFVEVRLPAIRSGDRIVPQLYAIGPCGDRLRAYELAAAWEGSHGDDTAQVYRTLPEGYAELGQVSGSLDARFEAESDAAVDQWYADPGNPPPSCMYDEIRRLGEDHAASSRPNDEAGLLDEIGDVMRLSGERVRQLKVQGLDQLELRLKERGMTAEDLLEDV